MIPDDHHIEVLAMNLWMGLSGITVIQREWVEWASAHPDDAKALRDQAETMIGAARSHAKKPTAPNHHHHHGLGWLFNG